MRLELDPDLNVKVAEVTAPHVAALADRARALAQERAPRVKVWRTMFDERVRPWHVTAHGQGVPENLRFALDQSPRTYKQHQPPATGNVQWGVRYDPEHTEYLREPRDPTAHWTQREWCRCFLEHNDELARSIGRSFVVVDEHGASCTVYTRFPRAAESEFGTAEDTPALFFTLAAAEARL